MGREKDLAKNTVVLSIGAIIPKIIALVTIPILTGQLSKSDYGIYDLVTTLVTLLLPVATLQIQSAAFRFLIESRGDKEKSNAIANNIFIVTIPITVFVLFFVFLGFHNVSVLNRLLICCYYFVDIIYLAVQQIVRGLSHNIQYSVGTVVLSIFNMVLLIVLVLVEKMELSGTLMAMLGSCTVATLYLISVMLKEIDINFKKYYDWKLIKEMLAYSWPMVPNNLSNWVLQVSDRFIITFFLGLEANAVYAVANKIPSLFASLQGIFILAWQENASIVSEDSDADEYYSNMFWGVYCILAGGMACLIAITPFLFKIVIRGDYEEAYMQMPILFIGILFSCMASFLGGIYVAKKNIVSVGITTMCAAVSNLIIDLLFVNAIGIYAGSISTVVSYVLLTLFRMIDLYKKYGIKYKIARMLFILAVMILISFFCYMKSTFLDMVNVILAVALLGVSNRMIFISLIKKVKNKIKSN